MYSPRILDNLKTINQNLLKLEGEQGKNNALLQEIMEQLEGYKNAFGVSYWSYADIEQLLEDEGIMLPQSEIVEIAEAADKRLRESMTEAGWETLAYFVDEHISNKNEGEK